MKLRKYTLNKMVENGRAKAWPQYVAALSVCLGAVAGGSVLGWTANISEKLKRSELNDIDIDSNSLGWIGSFVTLGALLMCFPIGYICDLIGRKWGCLVIAVPILIGWLLIIFSNSLGMVYAGRFLTGLAGGAFCVAAPIYSAEIAQSSIRGALGSYFQLLQSVGILLVYVGGAYMSPRALAILSASVPVIFAVVFFFQPESPVHLIKKNKHEDAKKSLQRLRGSNYDCDIELKEIKDSLDKGSNKVSFREAVKTKAAMKASVIAFGLMFFQQLSGINAVIFYTGDIFEASGGGLSSETGTIIVGILQTVSTFVSSLVVDKFGRKILLLLSIIFMGISVFVLGLFFSFKDRHLLNEDQLNSIGVLPVLSLGVFIVMFSMGIGPIPWMISAEVMPPEIKSTMCSFVGIVNWGLAFIVTKFYGNLKESVGGDTTFYSFAIVCFVGAVFVLFCIPETKGKSLTEIQALLNGDVVKAPSPNKKDGIDNPNFKD